jgi:hypothetical protein
MNPTSSDLIDKYHGVTDLKKVTFDKIPECEERLVSRYSKLEFFRKEYTYEEKNEIYLTCSVYNAFATTKCVGACAAIGAIAGGLVGGVVAGPPGIATGASIGGSAGVFTGFGVSYKKGYISSEHPEYINFCVGKNPKYKAFEDKFDKKQYKLFFYFLNNHLQNFSPAELKQLDAFICPITLEIPRIPVFSPHDIYRQHPFEKSAIVSHLEIIEEKVRVAKASGYDDDYIDAIRINSDPLRRAPFVKSELVYDAQYTRNVIKFLKEIYENMKPRITETDDPILIEGMLTLIAYYCLTYSDATDAIVSKLRNDIIKLGGTYERAEALGNLLKVNLSKV